jgi:hypothetical protein
MQAPQDGHASWNQEVEMTRRAAGLTTLLIVTTFCVAQAQSRLALELRAGPAFPTADMSTPTFHTGAGFGAALNFQVLPAILFYAGWDWHHFAFDKPFSGNEYEAADSGYTVCVQFQRPMAGALASWIRAGVIYNHIEVENPEGSIVAGSGDELGWEVRRGSRASRSELSSCRARGVMEFRSPRCHTRFTISLIEKGNS